MRNETTIGEWILSKDDLYRVGLVESHEILPGFEKVMKFGDAWEFWIVEGLEHEGKIYLYHSQCDTIMIKAERHNRVCSVCEVEIPEIVLFFFGLMRL